MHYFHVPTSALIDLQKNKQTKNTLVFLRAASHQRKIISYMRKQRNIKQTVSIHKAGKLHSWDFNPGSLATIVQYMSLANPLLVMSMNLLYENQDTTGLEEPMSSFSSI